MSASGVVSEFQFESYKMDKIDFKVEQNLSVLASKSHSDCEVNYTFGFRNVLRFKREDSTLYVSGLQIEVEIFQNTSNEKLAEGTFVITGLFRSKETLEKEAEENLAKFQAPTILFPYIRASISATLSAAGFSSMIMPLINVNASASRDIIIEDK